MCSPTRKSVVPVQRHAQRRQRLVAPQRLAGCRHGCHVQKALRGLKLADGLMRCDCRSCFPFDREVRPMVGAVREERRKGTPLSTSSHPMPSNPASAKAGSTAHGPLSWSSLTLKCSLLDMRGVARNANTCATHIQAHDQAVKPAAQCVCQTLGEKANTRFLLQKTVDRMPKHFNCRATAGPNRAPGAVLHEPHPYSGFPRVARNNQL